MVSPQVVKEVGSRLGEVEEVEWKKKKDDLIMFMRVRVALPISKPLRRGGFIAGSDGLKSWVTFKYERLPMFCHYCGILGHDLKHCAGHYAMEKKGGHIEYQYGDYLRALGSRSRVPGSKAAGPSAIFEVDTGCEAGKEAVQAEQGDQVRKTTAQPLNTGNPRETDKEKGVIHGTNAELLHVDSLDSNCHANVTTTADLLDVTGPKFQHPN